MKGYIGIQAKIRQPVLVVGEDGVAQERFDYDSLYVEDPNKEQQIMLTHESISIEIEKNKKNQFYLGDSQDQSMLKKDAKLSKIEISRAIDDPNYIEDFG